LFNITSVLLLYSVKLHITLFSKLVVRLKEELSGDVDDKDNGQDYSE
jgi:hypothetical protein